MPPHGGARAVPIRKLVRGRHAFRVLTAAIGRPAAPFGAVQICWFLIDPGSRRLPDSGPGRLVWGKINGEESGPGGKRKYEEFFVGTEQQFKDPANLTIPGGESKDAHPRSR